MYVLKHIAGMDYLAGCAGREGGTNTSIDFALQFETRAQAEDAERITPGMWVIEETP